MYDQNQKPFSRQAVIEMLAEHGVQPTQQRVLIGMVLFARDRHLSADDVLTEVNAEKACVSKATVYNTLGLFADRGLIREVIVDPSRVFYDPNTSAHHHFYNVDTGKLADIDADQFELTNMPPLPEGTVAEGVDVIIRVRNNAPADSQ